ncbi:MAG TPA: tRNA uridine-5-carboxymethylaminomethyl(34) synthesis enzyme MnmG [Bacteroidetes bacterium]|nr:tRNA uridine-5-carboxymethylaminomethyl(34) synthesis enzyme MnmG [Bacteroidota bacterium]
MNFKYDIIVVGGGHAGCEAAHAAAKMGMKTVLITMDMTKLAQMSCNPAMGGIAKGQIIREIDALGGLSGLVTDESMIQYRLLNRSKGPAMWSPRAQSDRMMFSQAWRKRMENVENLHIWQEMAREVIIEGGTARGVVSSFGTIFNASAVILSGGTFLNGLMHVGYNTVEGGRSGDETSRGISEQLGKIGFTVERMKTGTSARIDGRSIDFSVMTEQKSENEGRSFSFLNDCVDIEDPKSCYIVHTSRKVHEVLEKGIEFSPLFQGRIKGIGPRYCPSIEDKIVTFKEKDRHQLFLEPEGWNTNEYYINGYASSLPLEFQLEAMKKIRGMENVVIHRPGYAIEYDFFQPTQLKASLETKRIRGLYFAGQINGTTGYEEAAAQGLMAGINAVLRIRGEKEFVLKRDESYIGVLIDDLVTKGVDEPYRMFTSRAEYRILLRQDNADERLTEKGYELGLAERERVLRLEKKRKSVEKTLEFIERTRFKPAEINDYLEAVGTNRIRETQKMEKLILRPQVRLEELLIKSEEGRKLAEELGSRKREIIEAAEIRIKYRRYIEREKGNAEKIKRMNDLLIPDDIEYDELKSISTEGRQKLNRIKPGTIGAASRISGVSPADISVLLLYLGK